MVRDYSWAITMTSQDWGVTFHRPDVFIVSNLAKITLKSYCFYMKVSTWVCLPHPSWQGCWQQHSWNIKGENCHQCEQLKLEPPDGPSQYQYEHNVRPLNVQKARGVRTPTEHPPVLEIMRLEWDEGRIQSKKDVLGSCIGQFTNHFRFLRGPPSGKNEGG